MPLTVSLASAQTEKFLHSFSKNGKDGYQPSLGGLVFDVAGNLYGATATGGHNGCGTVFELSARAGGGWAEKVLYSFKGHDGRMPQSQLIFDGTGNLYGTTASGGANGAGTVFELSPNAGVWTLKTLHNFANTADDGSSPISGVTMDPVGNLYGVTNYGGNQQSGGTAYELSPSSSGTWTETILWNFDGRTEFSPQGPLVFDSAGNLYGVTQSGLVYGLSLSSGGGWTQTILYDGAVLSPAGLTIDSVGNLYGVSFAGGAFEGEVFEVSPSSGTWTGTTLYSFNSSLNNDGAYPAAALTLDAAGNLYGTTSGGGGGGCSGGCGTVFKLMPSGGSWTETILHRFGNGIVDGQDPRSSVVLDAAGSLYGTTESGGNFGEGMAFEIVP